MATLERQTLAMLAEGEAEPTTYDTTISSTRVPLTFELENARLIEPETPEEEEEEEEQGAAVALPVGPVGPVNLNLEIELEREPGGGGGGGGGGGSAAQEPLPPAQPAQPAGGTGAKINWAWVAGATGAAVVVTGVAAWFFAGRKGEGKRQPNKKRKRR